MDDTAAFALPEHAFVEFDDDPTVTTRRGARHAIDVDASASFFRRYGVDLTEADSSDVRSLGDLLSTVDWETLDPGTFDRPADAVELDDLTRVFLAYGAAGADLRPVSAVSTYLDDDSLRSTARATADGCTDCTAARFDDLNATYYEACNPHRRALYRRAVESEAAPDPDLDAVDVPTRVDRLDDAETVASAAADLARVAREDPERVRPARDALFDVLDSLRTDPFADDRPVEAAATALAGLATVDAETRTRLVELLADDYAGVRRWAATAVAVAAATAAGPFVASDEDDEGLLGRVLRGRTTPPAVARLAGMYDDESPTNRARALFALTELARDEPGAVALVADVIVDCLGDENADVRFRAAAAVGALAREEPDEVADAVQTLRRMTTGADGPVADAAVVGLAGCLAGGLDVGRERDDLRAALRTLVDPSRNPDRTVREATFGLGAVGTTADVDYLEWVRACARAPRLTAAADRAARDLRRRV